jgi:hypothetical protein
MTRGFACRAQKNPELVLFAAGDLCATGEVVSATEQDFEPTERRRCHGILGTSRWKFKQRFAGAHPH